MKHVTYILLFLLATATCSCVDEDKMPFNDFQRGTIPLFAQNEDDAGFISATDPSQSVLSFTLDKLGYSEVTSIDIKVTYTRAATGEQAQAVVHNISVLPASVQITGAQIVEALGDGVTLAVGDEIQLDGAMVMADGRYLDGGYSASIVSRHPVSLTYFVSCSSNIPSGDYTAVTNATISSDPDCDNVENLTDLTYDVTLSADGPLRYEVSDFFGGTFMAWYGDCYGYDFETPAGFVDICGALNVEFTDAFGGLVEGTGAFDPETGTITYTWESEFGGSGTTVLTPK